MGDPWILPVLLVRDEDDEGKYKEAFPGLLDDAYVVYADQLSRAEGLRVTRLFVSHSIDPDSEIVRILHTSMTLMPKGLADELPIYLRLSFTYDSRMAFVDQWMNEERSGDL